MVINTLSSTILKISSFISVLLLTLSGTQAQPTLSILDPLVIDFDHDPGEIITYDFSSDFPEGTSFSGTNWTIDNGRARSNRIGSNGRTSFWFTVSCSDYSFDYRTSTESCCDKLGAYVDGRTIMS